MSETTFGNHICKQLKGCFLVEGFRAGTDITTVAIGSVEVFYRVGVSNRDGVNPDSMRAEVDLISRCACCCQRLIADNSARTCRGIRWNQRYGRTGAPHIVATPAAIPVA